MKNKLSMGVVIAGLCFGAVARAEPQDSLPFRQITLNEAVAATMENNSGLKADSLTVAIQKEHLRQARLFRNPEVVIEAEDISASRTGVETSAGVSVLVQQTFQPFARRRAVTVLRREAEGAAASLKKNKADLIAETKTRFLDVLLAQRILLLRDSLHELSRQVLDASVQRAVAGKVALADTLRASAEFSLSAIEREQSRAELQNARQRLAALWGSSQANFAAAGNELDSLPPLPALDIFVQRLALAPQSQIWDSELKKDKAALGLQKAQRIPPITVGGGIVTGIDTPSTKAELSISIPLFDRNQGAIKAARHSVAKSQHSQKEALVRLAQEIRVAHGSAAQALHQTQSIEKGVLPQLEEAYSASYLAYAAGKSGLLEMLDAQRRFLETARDRFESAARYRLALVELERMTGLIPETK